MRRLARQFLVAGQIPAECPAREGFLRGAAAVVGHLRFCWAKIEIVKLAITIGSNFYLIYLEFCEFVKS
jgi:hypothetical protein